MKPAAANPYTAADLVADRPWLLGLGTSAVVEMAGWSA